MGWTAASCRLQGAGDRASPGLCQSCSAAPTGNGGVAKGKQHCGNAEQAEAHNCQTHDRASAELLPKAVVNTGCQLRQGCIVNCGAIVDHDCILEPGVHICLGAIIKAENRIPQCMKIEAGQIISNRTYPID